MSKMRAKLQVSSVFPHHNTSTGETTCEQLSFHGVAAGKYPDDGSDENNTFAKFSPSVNLQIIIANPALFGTFKPGDKFYVDFSPAE